jgi:BetR domain
MPCLTTLVADGTNMIVDNIQASLTTPAGSIELTPPAWVVNVRLSDAATEIVSENIRAQMARGRQTGEQLAAVLKVSQSVTSKRIRGVVAWELGELLIVAETLGVDLSALLVGIEQLPTAA